MRKRQATSLRVKKRLAPPPVPPVAFFRLALFLTAYFLIKLGQFPQYLLQKVSKFTAHKIKVVLKLRKMGKEMDLTRYFKKKRGRPRTTPFFPFYFKKIRRAFYRAFPRPARIRIALAVLAFMLLGYSLGFAKLIVTLPKPSQLTPTGRPLTTQVFDRNGELLYQFYEDKNRKLVKLEELPQNLINATIAIEDRHFFYHPGFDPIGIVRAVSSNMKSSGTTLQGGSTITQQLVKNTLLTPDQTLARKIKEIVLAFWAERVYNKKEILQMYFNEAPYGGPAWGIETAAEMYFGKNARDLNLSESAYLAGLPAAPTQYSPYGVYPEQGRQRQRLVLQRMVEDGYISQREADEATKVELSFKTPLQDIKAPHFVMYLRFLLAEKYGEKAVSQGGMKVVTTLDLGMQEMAEKVVAEQIDKLKNLKVGNGAAMVTNPKNGEILAMVGSKDYFDPEGGSFNVTLALRQPGSSIKPVTYATGFKMGYSPGTTLLDAPTTFPPPAGGPWGQAYSPVNYDGYFHGPVSIRTALGSSYNVPAVKMLAMVGIPEMLKTAREMGITTLTDTQNYGLSLTLGGGGVKLLEMMSVYGTLASGGVRYTSNPILQVTDASGDILENHREPSGRRALTEEIAYLLSNILSDNSARTPAFGANSQLNIPKHTVAVKTGTSDDKRDNWVFGYTPEYVVGVWVGNNDNSPMDPRLTSGITGATPIFHDIMANILADRPDLAFKRPAGIVEKIVDGKRDLAISGATPKTVVGYKTVKQKDGQGEEKEVTLFSDQFSSFTSTKSAQLIPTQTAH